MINTRDTIPSLRPSDDVRRDTGTSWYVIPMMYAMSLEERAHGGRRGGDKTNEHMIIQ